MRSFVAVCCALGAAAQTAVDADGCVKDYHAGADYFPSAAQLNNGLPEGHSQGSQSPGATASIVFANLFQVDYYPTYKVVHLNSTIQAPGPFYGQAVPPLVLSQCGTPQPVAGAAPGVAPDARMFRTPLSSVAVPGTVPLTFLHMLGLLGKIRVIDSTHVSTPCIQKAVGCGVVPNATPADAAWATAVGQADAVITDMWLTGATNSAKDIPFDATADLGPLGRAEWIHFVSLFFNREGDANGLFNLIRADYNNIKAQATALGSANPPIVAWVSYSPSTNWTIEGGHYKRGYVEDAGGAIRVLPSPITGCEANAAKSRYTCDNAAAFHAALAGVDMLIDESYEYDPSAHGTSDFMKKYGFGDADRTNGKYPFLVNNKVYRLDLTHAAASPSGERGLAWFETGTAYPNRMLSDIARALYGEDKTLCGREYLRHMSLDGHEPTSPQGHDTCSVACQNLAADRAMPAKCAIRLSVTPPPPVVSLPPSNSATSLAPLVASAIAGAAAALL